MIQAMIAIVAVLCCSVAGAQTASDFMVVQNESVNAFNTAPVMETHFISYDQEAGFSTAPPNVQPEQYPQPVAPMPKKHEVQVPEQASPVTACYSAPASYVHHTTPIVSYNSAPRRWFGGRWFGGGRRAGGRVFGIFRRGGC